MNDFTVSCKTCNGLVKIFTRNVNLIDGFENYRKRRLKGYINYYCYLLFFFSLQSILSSKHTFIKQSVLLPKLSNLSSFTSKLRQDFSLIYCTHISVVGFKLPVFES